MSGEGTLAGAGAEMGFRGVRALETSRRVAVFVADRARLFLSAFIFYDCPHPPVDISYDFSFAIVADTKRMARKSGCKKAPLQPCGAPDSLGKGRSTPVRSWEQHVASERDIEAVSGHLRNSWLDLHVPLDHGTAYLSQLLPHSGGDRLLRRRSGAVR